MAKKDTYTYSGLKCGNCDVTRKLVIPIGIEVTDEMIDKANLKDICSNCGCKGKIMWKG